MVLPMLNTNPAMRPTARSVAEILFYMAKNVGSGAPERTAVAP